LGLGSLISSVLPEDTQDNGMNKKSKSKIAAALNIDPVIEEVSADKIIAPVDVITEETKEISLPDKDATSELAEPLLVQYTELAEQKKSEADRDYDTVRRNLHKIVKKGEDAIDTILTIAECGESPRAFEVVAQMIKTVADVNKDLLDLHAKKKEYNKEEINIDQSTSTNVFLSTSDLLDLANPDRSKNKRVQNEAMRKQLEDNDG